MAEWGLTKSISMLLIASAFAVVAGFMLFAARTERDVLLGFGVLAFFGSMIPFSMVKLAGAIGRGRTPIDDPASTRVFCRPTREVAALTVMALGLGLGCYLMLALEPAKAGLRIAAWVAIVMCGFGVVAIPVMARLRPIRLVLAPQGLDFTFFKVGLIEWRDIVGVGVGHFMRSDVVSLDLADPEKYFARGFPKRGRNLKWLSGAFASPFVFVPSQFGASTEAVVEAIKLRMSAFGGTGAAPAIAAPVGVADSNQRREPYL